MRYKSILRVPMKRFVLFNAVLFQRCYAEEKDHPYRTLSYKPLTGGDSEADSKLARVEAAFSISFPR